MNSRCFAPVFLVASAVMFAGCGDASTQPTEAHAQEAFGSQAQEELLLTILDRLDDIERRLEESGVPQAQMSGRPQSDGLVTQADGPPDGRGGNRLALLEARTDSLMALVSFLARGTTQPFQGFLTCAEFGLSGTADLKTRTESRAEGEGSVGVRPWDTGALAQVRIAQWGMLEFGTGANLGVKASGCLDLLKIGAEPPEETRPLPSTSSLLRSASVAGTGQLESTLMNLGDRLGLTPSDLDRAATTGTEIFESGDFRRLADLPSTLPTPGGFDDPLQLVSNRVRDFDPVDLLCGPQIFGARIQSRVTEACGLIQADDLPDVTAFASLDLDALDELGELTDACDGQGLTSCMAALDNRISRVCSTSSDLRSKLATGIFHSDNQFRFRPLDWILDNGGVHLTVTGVSSLGWDCRGLIQT